MVTLGRWQRGSTVAGALALLGSLFMASPAQASTSYEDDVCSSTSNKYCFEIYYNSRGETTGYSYSSCFIANQSIPDHFGYSPNGAVVVRYIFRGGVDKLPNPGCTGAEGSGQALKNNAASVANNECSVSNRVYYNSGYQGTSETFSPGCGSYWPASNLKAELKNENASHKRI
ncbi:hypothetical protein SUDANB176_03476 [Streptomyces sp. enrichment culture]|uniref:hypothetical protein n=1 Tax=Streptomyces sp. enrichment culture TaxID=1795815 RepID=UPI003F54B364